MFARRLLILLGAASFLVAACTDDDPATAPASTSVGGAAPTPAAVPASTPVASEPVPSPAEPMTAPRDATQELRDLLGTPGPTVERADELARTVAELLVAGSVECESGPATATVVSVTPGEPTFAVIELREGCDDSVAGARYDVAMEGDDTAGWGIVAATRQDICRRGVGGSELCV